MLPRKIGSITIFKNVDAHQKENNYDYNYNSKVRFCLIASFAFIFLLAGCSVKHTTKINILSSKNEPLNDVVVLPLYRMSKGFFSVDGKGLHSDWNYVVEKPILVNNSSRNIETELGTGIMMPFPPFVYIGTVSSLHSLLVMKKFYIPKVIHIKDYINEIQININESQNNNQIENIGSSLHHVGKP